ncbi:hypothetical protein NVP1091O_25 [Vibrio phage 1.091.O._10N.286.52.B12]|nr:hypothetical protein NVP1091O_25 [Vibrio phage 1.091.O._10N.286.52.B12]
MKFKYSNKAKAIRNLRDAAIMRMDDESVERYQNMLDAELAICKVKK